MKKIKATVNKRLLSKAVNFNDGETREIEPPKPKTTSRKKAG